MDTNILVCYIIKGDAMRMRKKIKVDSNRAVFHTGEVLTLVLLTCIISLFVGSMVTNRLNYKNNYNSNDKYIQNFINNYQYILENYYGDIDKETLMKGALSGMLSVLGDDYSTLFDGTSADNFNIQLDGNYDGVGVEIYKYDNKIIILRVFSDSPAEKAGLKSGDIILSVDGKNYTETSDLSSYIRNSDKNSFELEIIRDEETKSVTLKRSEVTIPSVSSQVYEKNGKKIGYIYIGIFANATTKQFETKLKELEDEQIDSLIIDVRNNSGGHLTTAVSILSNLLDKTHVIYQTETKNKAEKFYSNGKQTKTYPIVVLQNNASASASELLSIALKEEYGATVIGNVSYGKGTVQELVNSNSAEYKFTTKKWLSPKGNWINETGVKPDIEVEQGDSYSDNPIDENDTQLQAALNYLAP